MLISTLVDGKQVDPEAPAIESSLIMRALTATDNWRRIIFVGSNINLLFAPVEFPSRFSTTKPSNRIGLFFLIAPYGKGAWHYVSGRYTSESDDGPIAIESCKFFTTRELIYETIDDIIEVSTKKSINIFAQLEEIKSDFALYTGTYTTSYTEVPIYNVFSICLERAKSAKNAYFNYPDGYKICDTTTSGEEYVVNDGNAFARSAPITSAPKYLRARYILNAIAFDVAPMSTGFSINEQIKMALLSFPNIGFFESSRTIIGEDIENLAEMFLQKILSPSTIITGDTITLTGPVTIL